MQTRGPLRLKTLSAIVWPRRTMLRIQPTSLFGDWLRGELAAQEGDSRRWRTFEFAVAWVNDAGAKAIEESAQDFLGSGGRIRAVVGLDFGSTSVEGLQRLLALEVGDADMETYVFFDENRACTFHPKVFLFRNAGSAVLAVGSNNFTGAGLRTNIEAALTLRGALSDDSITDAIEVLAGWRDSGTEARSKRLTEDLLAELQAARYVLTEQELTARRASDAGSQGAGKTRIFGRSQTRPKHDPGENDSDGRAEGSGETRMGDALLMRVRPRRNGRQIQISLRILEGFMQDAGEVWARDGSRREIGYNMTRGVANTARFEAPEMELMTNPVARFQWVNDRIAGRLLRFEIFDADQSAVGAQIYTELRDGIGVQPTTDLSQVSRAHTVLSITDRDRAQWYRLSPEA